MVGAEGWARVTGEVRGHGCGQGWVPRGGARQLVCAQLALENDVEGEGDDEVGEGDNCAQAEGGCVRGCVVEERRSALLEGEWERKSGSAQRSEVKLMNCERMLGM